ncbi:Protein LIKE COV 3 [Glycine soja]|uniref:Protein LIKE COV 3 n=1 Tax=Glycine soja TaxID=3848 RepID=A0A445F049_GLYSO|nr:Protein LIKE COV 3 [Glycine soja]
MSSTTFKVLTLMISVFAIMQISRAGDLDILTDFIVPPNTIPDGNLFTFIGFRVIFSPNNTVSDFKVLKATKVEFSALDVQSVSYATLEFPSGSIHPPHTHSLCRATLHREGTLQVGYLTDQGSNAFKEVAIIRHPRVGEYALGFITSSMVLRNKDEKEIFYVYIPTNHLYLCDIYLISPEDILFEKR